MHPRLVLCGLLSLSSAFSQQSVSHWFYSAAGASPSAIQSEVDRFRRDLGDLNPNEARSFPSGRREINWDAVGGANGSDNLPGDFFHRTSPRGLIMSTPGQRLKVSGNRDTPSFLMRDVTREEWGLIELAAFSGDKLFAPMGSTITDIEFRVPGTEDAACVPGFGVVFVDVDRGGQSAMEVTLSDGSTRRFVALSQAARSKGMSFTGVRFSGACIASVRVINGDHPVDTPHIPVPLPDGVAVDDFIYGEPVPVQRRPGVDY